MPISAKTARIGGAIVIAVFLVAGAYVLPGFNLPKTKPVNAELTDELLANYVAKDTDGDALPDWQEALYGTDSTKADTDGDGISDGEAVRRGLLTPTALSSQLPEEPIGEEDIPGEAPAPGSLTEQFSRAFFEAYIQASGGQPLSEEAQQQLLQQLLAEYTKRASTVLTSSYTQVSVRTNTSVSVQAYAANVESIFNSHEVDLEGENIVSLIQKTIEQNDKDAEAKLVEAETGYGAMSQSLLAAPVPPSLASQHLLLVKSLDTLSKACGRIARYQSDPLAVMGALAVFTPASQDFMSGVRGIANVVLQSGEPMKGMPGAYLIEIARSAETP